MYGNKMKVRNLFLTTGYASLLKMIELVYGCIPDIFVDNLSSFWISFGNLSLAAGSEFSRKNN